MDTAIPSAINTGTVQAARDNTFSGVSGGDFMNILIKQLQFQDPFDPMGNAEMIAQMSSIRELELNTRLAEKLEQLTDNQRFGAVAALIGKYAKGTVEDAEGNSFEVEGLVTSVRFTPGGNVMLELDTGEVLPLTDLQEVKNPSEQGIEA